MHDESKNRICRYADSLDVITSVVNTIHDAVDNTINPSRAMRALAKNGSNVVITHTASAFSGLAGSSIGATIGTLIFPGAGAAVGAAVGGLSAGLASKELTKKVLEKTPLKKINDCKQKYSIRILIMLMTPFSERVYFRRKILIGVITIIPRRVFYSRGLKGDK
ncbi:hypothetical protein PTT03_10670 [Serratia ureilytica]|uniref:glycine zipper domain-containing protein n=1 Tax=Serratia ureilytica TaxID=300181 RepID=UPI00313B0E7F